jgi:hypothetical protein
MAYVRPFSDLLTRISHRLPAATVGTLAQTALRSVDRLDVLSSTPATVSVARLVWTASRPFRDGTGEKCGLGTRENTRSAFKRTFRQLFWPKTNN